MYAQHFNLRGMPFSIAPNPRYVYLSPKHREALAHLLYGIGVGGGFVVLTGEVGAGKTTLCRCLLESLPEDVEIALVFNPRLNSRELLATICDELHIVYPLQKPSLKLLIDLLNRHLLKVHASGKRTIVLIDEAQNLSFDVLEQIRLLTNLETNETKLLQIILVAQPELNVLLKHRRLRQLAQRITARFHLQPLSLRETRGYIRHRLEVAGGSTDIISEAAIVKIHGLAGGIPRLINLVCDRALLGAYTLGKTKVGVAVVRKAAKEILPPVETRPRHAVANGILWGVVGMLTIVGSLYFKAVPMGDHFDALFNKFSSLLAFAEQAKNLPQQQALTDVAASEPGAVKAAIPPANDPSVSGPPAPAAAKPSFAELAANADATRKSAFDRLFKMWGLTVPPENADACRSTESQGLRCYTFMGSWLQLLNLGLPAVLAFDLDGGQRYALLHKIDGENAKLYLGEKSYDFDPAEFLPFWQGDATLLWKPPTNKTIIKPGYIGKSVMWLRRQFGMTAKPHQERYYDKPLQERVIAFQKEHGINPDGIVDESTLIQLSRNGSEPTLFESGSNALAVSK